MPVVSASLWNKGLLKMKDLCCLSPRSRNQVTSLNDQIYNDILGNVQKKEKWINLYNLKKNEPRIRSVFLAFPPDRHVLLLL